MSVIEPLLQHPAAQAIAWALLHFVWQGTLIAALTAVILFLLRPSAADVRYVVSSIALALMLTIPVVTAVQMFTNAGDRLTAQTPGRVQPPSAEERRTPDLGPRPSNLGPRPSSLGPRPSYLGPRPSDLGPRPSILERLGSPARLLPTFLLLWLTGVGLLSLRLLTGWWWIHRLRTHGIAPAAARWQNAAARICRRLHIARTVTLVESALVLVPTVVGWMKPVVLLPASALAALSPDQLEAILAHEYAHIRRHDYLVNVLQTLVETLLFYHPAVWWLSRRIRIEREHCCDDLAVALCGDPVAYAGALADLEELVASALGRKAAFGRRNAAVAANGGSLLHRVRRLLGAPDAHDTRGAAWSGAAVAILLACGVTFASQGQPAQTPSTPAQTAAPASTARAAVAAAIPLPGGPAIATTVPRPATVPLASTAPAAVIAIAAPDEAQPPADRARAAADAASTRFEDAASALEARAAALAATSAQAQAATVARLGDLESSRHLAENAMAAAVAKAAGNAQSISSHQHGSSGNWVWSHNGEKLAVKYEGEFEFSDDDTDVKWISPGGSLQISDAAWVGRHTVEVRENGGGLQRQYWVNGSERPFEPEGRQWLHDHLPQFVRNTGLGAGRRVARILKSGGPSAVLAEISRIEGDHVKGVYFGELLRQASPDAATYRQALAQAGREIHSDYTLATLLISLADKLPADDPSRAAYFDAARGIHSDYELHRVYTAMLKRGPVASPLLASVLRNATAIKSDYELSQLLQQIAGLQRLDGETRGPFFAALETISSDYERHRVLKAVTRTDADDATLAAALQASAVGSSDYERASFLLEALQTRGLGSASRASFFTALGRVQSSYERGRVLQAIVRDANAGHDVLLAALQSAKGMPSGYDLAQVLTGAAETHTLTGDLRDAYLDASDRLHGYDQDRVLTALVRSERRK